MADPRFFDRAGPLPLGELAERTGATLSANADPEKLIHDIGSLDDASGDTIVFLENRRYVPALQTCSAGACLIAPPFVDRAPSGMALLVTERPRRAFAKIAQTFYPDPPHVPGVHASAMVDPTAEVAENCRIGPNAVIGPGVEIGATSCSAPARSSGPVPRCRTVSSGSGL
jgi:UDP-3-O-[3-hydroxymyristoyl] glucosamine N-acyltransferase